MNKQLIAKLRLIYPTVHFVPNVNVYVCIEELKAHIFNEYGELVVSTETIGGFYGYNKTLAGESFGIRTSEVGYIASTEYNHIIALTDKNQVPNRLLPISGDHILDKLVFAGTSMDPSELALYDGNRKQLTKSGYFSFYPGAKGQIIATRGVVTFKAEDILDYSGKLLFSIESEGEITACKDPETSEEFYVITGYNYNNTAQIIKIFSTQGHQTDTIGPTPCDQATAYAYHRGMLQLSSSSMHKAYSFRKKSFINVRHTQR